MKVTKEQLKKAVLAQAADIGFMVDLLKSGITLLPAVEQQQLINHTMVELDLVEEYYIVLNVLTKIQYIFLESHEVYLHILTNNPTLTKGAMYTAISRGTKIKNHRIEKVKRGL